MLPTHSPQDDDEEEEEERLLLWRRAMALCKMAVFLMLFSLVLVVVRADNAVSDETSGGGSDFSLQAELEQLKSKVSVLGLFCLIL